MLVLKTFQEYLKECEEIGIVEEIVHSIAYVSGLPNAKPFEIVVFETGGFGQVLSLKENRLEVLLFSESTLKVDVRVTRTNQGLEIGAGVELLGQAINPLGAPIDNTKVIKRPQTVHPIDITAPGIAAREKIKNSLDTGVTMVDLMIPLGKGQRELVIGDRKTGKTNFIFQTILTQAKMGTICIYVAIGKKKLDIKKAEEFFIASKIMQNVIIVASSSQDTSGIIYITPYSAMAIAEYFKNQGREVLLVLDDLTTHARFYREISLLGKRFPGRNSYPGDIFYTHSKLLERAGNFKINNTAVSITCLPIVETTQGDLSGYIQTNIMSMTDGHIYFDGDLFTKGRRPAINLFLSVTRVGHQTQSTLRREISRELTTFLTLYEKMQTFVHFGAELSDTIKNTLSTGEKIHYFFGQTAHKTIPLNVQIFLFCLLWLGTWHNQDTKAMDVDMQRIIWLYETNAEINKKINEIIANAKLFNEFLNIIKSDTDLLNQLGVAKKEPEIKTPFPAAPIAPQANMQSQKPKEHNPLSGIFGRFGKHEEKNTTT